jgi:hypothetical protein
MKIFNKLKLVQPLPGLAMQGVSGILDCIYTRISTCFNNEILCQKQNGLNTNIRSKLLTVHEIGKPYAFILLT